MKNTLFAESAMPPKPFWGLRAIIWFALGILLIASTISVFGASPSSAVSPTATPTATANFSVRSSRTPSAKSGSAVQSVPGQPQVDQYTVALYHFDSPNSVAIDATGRYTGTLHGNAAITDAGLYAGVLLLDGNGSYVRTGHLGNLSEGTVEAFVDYQSACIGSDSYRPIISAVNEATGQTVFAFGRGVLDFVITVNGQTYFADSGINPCRYLAGPSGDRWPYETWRFHHVAATWGPRGMEIWVDGVLHGVGNNDPNYWQEPYKYMCNPQMQMGGYGYPPNDQYPRCKTPVMAPTMPAYPPGAYTGGLPPYTTFRIGCDTIGCINSRIDEVRISNIQRTFQWTVVPTVTPIPTQTPVPITGEYSVDSNTLALYHMNSQAGSKIFDEASQTWNGYLANNATITSGGRFDKALLLDGNGSHAQAPKLIQGNGSVEMWIKLSNAPSLSAIFSAGNTNGSDTMYLGFIPWVSNSLIFSVQSNEPEPQTYAVDSGFKPILGCWHHVAGTWGTRGLQVWVDGTLRGTFGYYGAPSNYFERALVGCNNGLSCVQGLIDEVRISSVQRTFTRSAPIFRNRAPSSGSTSLYLPFVAIAPTPSCPN